MWWKNIFKSRKPRARSRADSLTSRLREVEFLAFISQHETWYPPWWTRERVIAWFHDLPDNTLWNCYICGCVLMGVVWRVALLSGIYFEILDVIYNISYAIHIFAIGYKMVTDQEHTVITHWTVLGFVVDLGSFAHYFSKNQTHKLAAYYVRLHRPYKYLWSLNDYNLKGSILGTALKYCYIFMVLRITWAYVWLHVDEFSSQYQYRQHPDEPAKKFLNAIYLIYRMFIPIGPTLYPDNDRERIVCLLVMLTGCLVVIGAAVASLSLIISLYMRPEETFRSRYRLIIQEMKETNVPVILREKVETFYKMYWHKQRAVSETRLLPTFPPTLPATINVDIYFEATQKTRILRDLSYQMLSELAKKMETIHYIPGDAIIKRGALKSKIIFITYGDVEMLTAEDDSTAILRLTRGTVLTPCAGVPAGAVGSSHLAVRAATFCTAHVLNAAALWRVVYKHCVTQVHAGPILASFTDHIERVKRHYLTKVPDVAIYKSSILQFNRNLMALKQLRDENGELLLASPEVFLEIAGCYIMRNRPDATLTDQSDEICLRPTFPCILQPSSSLLVAWNFFVAVLILAVCITHPYCLVYVKNVPLEFRFFDYVVTAVFVLDHIVYLSTGDNVEEGVPITFTQTASQQMCSHWFVLDVVATLPIFEFIGTGHFAGLNKLLRLPKLFRVLKSLEETYVYHSNVIRFLTYTLLLLIACYLIAAMQQSFMCFQAGYCLVTNLTHQPYWDEKPLDEETVDARLAFGLYWAISMITFTIHRETWESDDWKNVIYTLVILEICIVLRIFMEAVYSATIMVTTALREDYGSRIAMVKNFLITNDVDPQLRKRFITYLQLCWYTDKAYKMTHKKDSTIFYDLPPHVFEDIVGRNRSQYILCIPFMRLVKKEVLRTVSASAILFYTSPNEILINTGELTNEIYVIKQGICEVLDPVTKEPVKQLTTNNFFGGFIFLLRLPAYYTVRAVTHVQVISVPRKTLSKVLETPQIKEVIKLFKKEPDYQRLQTRLPSFVKYEPLPPIPNRMYFKLLRKHEPDVEFLYPFNKLGFLSVLRYVFPRYTIRPDGQYLVRYEWFRITCALCSAQLFPHYTYLVLQWPTLYYVTLFLDLSAWYDIFQRMLVGYFNEDGILVYHPYSTAAHYMKGAFLADLFGCLSLENLEPLHIESFDNKFRVTPTKQFLMLNRLMQLYRLPSAMMVLKEYIERRDIVMVIRAIPMFMAMLNIVTCFMIFYSVKIYYSVDENGDYDWVIEPFPDEGGSWLNLFANAFRFNMTETPWNLHLATYFWVVYECTTTGYGVFNPSNLDLIKGLFIGCVCSTMLITYYSVRIISIRASVNNPLAGFHQHMKDIHVYMMREKLDRELQKETRRYYEYNWEKMGGIDYRGVLKLCDQITLRTDAILHIYGPTFAKCPLLKDADVSLLRIIGRAVRNDYFLRDMKIIERDDIVTNMYLVAYGVAEVRVNTGLMTSSIRLSRGSVFGNLEGTECRRSPCDVVATGRLHLLMINSLTFSNITKDFPAVKVLMAKSRKGYEKAYILGGEAQVKTRFIDQTKQKRSKKGILKYIYFQGSLIQIYLIVICMSCVNLDLYNAGYQDNSTWLLITLYTLDFCFLLKILTQHFLPLLVTNRSIHTLMMPIRRLYFQREFRYDLISILPIEAFSYAATKNDWMWFGFLRLNRTFRIVTIYKCMRRRSESIKVNLTLTTVMAVFIWFTLFVHTTTCIWYFIGVVEDAIQPNSSWIHGDRGGPHCDNYYICSLYFVITTFTQNGVGDIMPKKQSEVLFVSILMILSTMVFMIYVGEFSSIIQYQSYRSFSFYSKYLELQEFMQNNRVSRNLVNIVNKYTLHLWRENRGLQIPHLLKHAPLSLRLRIMSAAYMHHMTKHHIFAACEPAFLRQLVGCLKLYTYNPGMYVVKESEITDSMYLIHTGTVRETCEDEDNSARVSSAGSYFGVLQGLIRNTPYTHSYQTMIKSQVLTLHLDDWEYLLKHFPDSRDSIHYQMSQEGDDMGQSNWPGGAPVPLKVFELEPLVEISGAPDLSQFPSTTRHFGRLSTEEDVASVLPSSSLKEQSRYNFMPADSRVSDTVAKRLSDLEEETRLKSLAETEEKAKRGFLGKFAKTAKKLMGGASEIKTVSATTIGSKDEFFLEEDEETTEALLAQFEAANKATKDVKKTLSRRKGLLNAQVEDTKKYMQSQEKESETIMMRPLRIRDDDEKEKITPSAKDGPEPTESARETMETQPLVDRQTSQAILETSTAEDSKGVTFDPDTVLPEPAKDDVTTANADITTSEDAEKEAESMSTAETEEEASTAASKLSRRFVNVRFEEESKAALIGDMDADMDAEQQSKIFEQTRSEGEVGLGDEESIIFAKSQSKTAVGVVFEDPNIDAEQQSKIFAETQSETSFGMFDEDLNVEAEQQLNIFVKTQSKTQAEVVVEDPNVDAEQQSKIFEKPHETAEEDDDESDDEATTSTSTREVHSKKEGKDEKK